MALPIILLVVAIGCYNNPSVYVPEPPLGTELFAHTCAITAADAAEWNAQLGQSHNDTIWPSGACVHVEPCHLLSDDIQVKTYFK